VVTVASSAAAASAIARALVSVASVDGTLPLSIADRRAVETAAPALLGVDEVVDADRLDPIEPAALGAAVRDARLRLWTIRMLAVVAFTDGVVESPKLQLVVDFADALEVRADFVRAIRELEHDNVNWAAHDAIRQNVASIPGMPLDREDPFRPFLPYGGAGADPALAERYRKLADQPVGTLGRSFYGHYVDNGYAFPGQEWGMAEQWATPHDSLHLLSGYSTSAQGELLVAAFTGAMLRADVDMMESHVLPTILIYHLGIDINKGLNQGDRDRIAADPSWRDNYQGNVHLGLDPAKVWIAWDRANAMSTDVYSGTWDFWSLIDVNLDDLREQYTIPALDPADAALPDHDIIRDDYLRPGVPPPPELGPAGTIDRALANPDGS
jgi:hypothetical protein